MQSGDVALWVIAALLGLNFLRPLRPISVVIEQEIRPTPGDGADWWKNRRNDEED